MRRKLRRSLRTSSPVLRRVFRPAVSRLEERTLLSTITWASDVSGDWDNPSMWTGGGVPGPSDDAVITLRQHHRDARCRSQRLGQQHQLPAALNLTNGSLAIATTSSISGSLTLQGASAEHRRHA